MKKDKPENNDLRIYFQKSLKKAKIFILKKGLGSLINLLCSSLLEFILGKFLGPIY